MKTAVVILNWNGKHHLETYLPSVVEHTKNAEIIIADNNSSDDSLDFLKRNFPNLRVITNDKNYGFAKGYNKALDQIKGEYDVYILLNSDVEVTENWDKPLIAALDDKNVVIQPEILAHQDKIKYEYAGAAGGFIDKNGYPFCRGRIFTEIEEKREIYSESSEIFWASGCCFCVKANVFHEFNGFSEDFFAHMEEIDLCWRIKNKGYSVLYQPDSTIYHLGGGSLQYESPFKTYLNFRNNLFMIIRNYHESNLFLKIVTRLMYDGLSGVRFLMIGQIKNCISIIKAHFVFYGSLGKVLEQRKQLKKGISPNMLGYYNRSIVWDFFVEGRKLFSGLHQKAFKS